MLFAFVPVLLCTGIFYVWYFYGKDPKPTAGGTRLLQCIMRGCDTHCNIFFIVMIVTPFFKHPLFFQYPITLPSAHIKLLSTQFSVNAGD